MNNWQPFIIAAINGLIVGIERERSPSAGKALGVRTFFILGLLGAVARAIQEPWLGATIGMFVFGLILISYFTHTKKAVTKVDLGLTTEFAAAMVFCLGYAAKDMPALSAIIGPLVALTLFYKSKIHRFTRRLEPSELESALLIFLAAVLVINLVPNRSIDPWGVIHPKKLGYLILTLAVLEFLSYVAVKIIGEKQGILVSGFLGGFVSSTAILVSSAKKVRATPSYSRNALCATLASSLAAFIELGFIVGVLSADLFVRLLIPLGIGFVFLSVALLLVFRKENKSETRVLVQTPLDWFGILRLSLLLGVVLAIVSLTKQWLGERATLAVSFITGFFELHGLSIANATLFAQGHLEAKNAYANILMGVVASFVSKMVLATVLGTGHFARQLVGIFLPLAGIFLLLAVLV